MHTVWKAGGDSFSQQKHTEYIPYHHIICTLPKWGKFFKRLVRLGTTPWQSMTRDQHAGSQTHGAAACSCCRQKLMETTLSSSVQSESSQASRGYLEDPFLVRSFAFTIFKNNFIIARKVLQSCLLNWPKPEMFCSSDADTTPLLREPKQKCENCTFTHDSAQGSKPKPQLSDHDLLLKLNTSNKQIPASSVKTHLKRRIKAETV